MLLEKLSKLAPQLRQHNDSHDEEKTSPLRIPVSMFILILLIVESIAITIMQGFVIHYHSLIFAHCHFTLESLGIATSDLISHGIYVITPIYQIFLYIDAVNQRNVFQLLMLLLFGFLVVVFTAIQTIQHMAFEKAGCDFSVTTVNSTNATISSKVRSFAVISNSTTFFQDGQDNLVSIIKPLDYTMLVVIAICFLILLGGTFKLYRLFKWNNHLFHTFNEIRLRNTLIAWSIFTGFLKIDVFFIFTYAVQLVPLRSIPIFESIIVFGLCLTVFLLATFAIRNESSKILAVFSVVLLGLVGYFGFRLFSFGMTRDANNDPFKLMRYDLLFTTLTLTLLMIMTLCTCIVCIRNISYHKLNIRESFKCVCPTCFAHSKDDTSSEESAVSTNEESSSSLQ